MKYHIEKNTVQETLVIPLFGRLVCSEHFPERRSGSVTAWTMISQRNERKWSLRQDYSAP